MGEIEASDRRRHEMNERTIGSPRGLSEMTGREGQRAKEREKKRGTYGEGYWRHFEKRGDGGRKGRRDVEDWEVLIGAESCEHTVD